MKTWKLVTGKTFLLYCIWWQWQFTVVGSIRGLQRVCVCFPWFRTSHILREFIDFLSYYMTILWQFTSFVHYIWRHIYIYNLRSAECVVINHAADRTNTGDASQHVAAIPVIARSHTDHSTLPRLAGPELAASGSALFFILLHVSAWVPSRELRSKPLAGPAHSPI